MAQLRLSKAVYTHLTSTTIVGKKNFFHQSVVPMPPTSWYTNIQATCFTFSIILYKRGCTHTRVRMKTHYLERDWAWPKIVLQTCSTYPWWLQVTGIKHLLILSLLFLEPIRVIFGQKSLKSSFAVFATQFLPQNSNTHQYIHIFGTKMKLRLYRISKKQKKFSTILVFSCQKSLQIRVSNR